jgi:hypothetical protein
MSKRPAQPVALFVNSIDFKKSGLLPADQPGRVDVGAANSEASGAVFVRWAPRALDRLDPRWRAVRLARSI